MNELFKYVPKSDAPISIHETIDARMAARDSASYSNDLCSDLPLTDVQEEKEHNTAVVKKSNKRSRKGKEEPEDTAIHSPTAPTAQPVPKENTKSKKKVKRESKKIIIRLETNNIHIMAFVNIGCNSD